MSKHKLKVGIIGTGRISDLHVIEYFNNPQTEITTLCDSNLEVAQAKAQKWGCAEAYITDDIDDVLMSGNVDIVEIILPHHLHYDVALKAMNAGKIISMQKPMTLNLDQATHLCDTVENYDRPVKIFENFIFYPPVLKAKELIDIGAIGEPLSIRIKSNPGYSESAWEVPKSADAWRQQLDVAGGGPLVFDDGHHKFALAWFFMGKATKVHSFIHQTPRTDGGYFDAPSQISFCFADSKIGNIEIVYSPELEINGNYYAQDDRIEITGTKGVIWVNGGHGHIGKDAPVVLYQGGTTKEFRDIASGWEQSFILCTRHFIEAIIQKSAPLLTVYQGREILNFALAAEQSAKDEQELNINYNF